MQENIIELLQFIIHDAVAAFFQCIQTAAADAHMLNFCKVIGHYHIFFAMNDHRRHMHVTEIIPAVLIPQRQRTFNRADS